ncbi:MAG: hypothetical protein GY919_08280 [Photobacterium aquimaris]|nr:hypothetical protein [Photobacterium aquimaris]
MNKKDRVNHLITLRNVIDNPAYYEIVPNKTILHIYNEDAIKAAIETIDLLLQEDGITACNANSEAK